MDWRIRGAMFVSLLAGCRASFVLYHRDSGALLPDRRMAVSPLVMGTEVSVILKDRRVVQGRLVHLTRSHLGLVRAKGDTVVVPKNRLWCVFAVPDTVFHPFPQEAGLSPLSVLGLSGVLSLGVLSFSGAGVSWTWMAVSIPMYAAILDMLPPNDMHRGAPGDARAFVVADRPGYFAPWQASRDLRRCRAAISRSGAK